MSVPTVSLPGVRVSSAPDAQAGPDAEAEAVAVGAVSSAGAQPATAASMTAALPSAATVFLLTMTGSLGHVPSGGPVRGHVVMSCNNHIP